MQAKAQGKENTNFRIIYSLPSLFKKLSLYDKLNIFLFVQVYASETVLFPEVPCDFKKATENDSAFLECVTANMINLRERGVVTEDIFQRMLVSMAQSSFWNIDERADSTPVNA